MLSLLVFTIAVLGRAQPTWANGVVNFYDGNNLIIVQGGIKTKVHLACIDAPDLKQPMGEIARDALKEGLRDKRFALKVWNRDRYGWLLAEILVEGDTLNRKLVSEGYVSFDRDRGKGCIGYEAAEQAARAAHLGIWADGVDLESPGEFRGNQHQP